jgi:hypothetical protein
VTTQLHKIIAVEKTVKANTENAFTKAYHLAQKTDLFAGLTKVYEPLVEDDVRLPGEQKLVQVRVSDLVDDVQAALIRQIDLTATKDTANGTATADIVVNGTVLATDVPVVTLLWIEKRLVDVKTFISKLPVLDPADTWSFDTGNGYYASAPLETMRQIKKPVFITVSPGSDKIAAQVVRETEDVPTGRWTTTKLSGAIPAARRDTLIAQVNELIEAVKVARQEANSVSVDDVRIGTALIGYLFR